MNLKPDAWYTRYFFWCADFIVDWHKGWKSGQNRDASYYRRFGTNLCQFARMTVLWPTLIILANLYVYGLWIYALFIYPFTTFAVTSILGFLIIVAISLGCLVLAALAGFYAPWEKLGDKLGKTVVAIERAKVTSGFFLVTTWIIDRHNKICRVVRFKSEGEVQ